MDESTALTIFEAFVRTKEHEMGIALAEAPDSRRRLSKGWAFYYQSLDYLTDRRPGDLLVGQGPVVNGDDGELVEGGSLDVDAEALLTMSKTYLTRAQEGSLGKATSPRSAQGREQPTAFSAGATFR